MVQNECSSHVRGSISEVLQVHPMPVLPLRRPVAQKLPSAKPRPAVDPAGLAYAIFTSGSTGLPKLAMVEHRGLLNHLQAKIETLRISSADIVAQNASQSFDISIWQVFAPLISGATVHVFDDETSRDPARIVDHVRRYGITILELVPALATLVFDELQKEANHSAGRLRCLMVTGEPVPADFCRKWVMAYPDIGLVNAYGPTECSDDVTHSMIDTPLENDSTSTPIGRAIRNTNLYILDSSFNLVPLSVPGELCVGGSAVGRGYHDHPALTADRFIPDCLDGGTGSRMYRTGDRAMWLEGGFLHLLGRKDHQVKLRGFRIEPGEIEAQLNNHPAVRGSVVTLGEDGAGNSALVVYVVPRELGTVSADDLRRFLSAQLPEYMVPSAFVFLSEFPLMVSGKVDRQALQALAYDPSPCSSGEPPRTAVEELLAGVWCRLLGCGQVGREDDFFRLGGHSLLATQLVSRVRHVFHVELPVLLIFQAPTLAKLAEKIEIARGSREERNGPEVTRATRDGNLPLSYAQQRLWFVERWLPGTGLYNMPFSVRLQGDLNESALEGALERIVERHESLRTTFAIRSGHPVQVIHRTMEQELSVVDLRHCREEQRRAEVSRLAEDEAERGFDLESGPLFRAKLVRLRAHEQVLLFTMHHIVSDEWSMAILVREVGEIYGSIVEGHEACLDPLVVQYADYAVWQREWLKGQLFEKQLGYWKRQLAGLPNLRQGTNRRRAPALGQGGSEEFTLAEELSARLRELSRSENVTLFITLLAGFQTLLALSTGARDVVVGTDHAGRGYQELEQIIGFFINPLVMRTDLSGNPTFRDVLQRVRSIALDAYAHADLPFDRLVQELHPDRDLSGQPLFQVKLVLLNTPQEQLRLPGLTAEPLEVRRLRDAKFDLALVIQDSSTKLCGSISYSAERYRATDIRRMVSRFSRLLDAVVSRPDMHLDEIDFFSDEERSVLGRKVEIDGLSAGLLYERQ
jgi:amino acid adenylation domain-containing protein